MLKARKTKPFSWVELKSDNMEPIIDRFPDESIPANEDYREERRTLYGIRCVPDIFRTRMKHLKFGI